MWIDYLGRTYRFIDGLSNQVKTIIIIVLLGFTMSIGIQEYSKVILRDYTEQVQSDKELAEEYTKMITPIINSDMEYILDHDEEASNVLLLNYHNTVTSTHGLSYRYLTSLTEKRRGIETSSCIRIWKELEYINYAEELERINSNKFLKVDSLAQYERTFPNLTELLQFSKAESAAFYPIIGVNGPIGMIVVIYKSRKTYDIDYYKRTIAPVIQPMSSLLDYNSIKDRFKENANGVRRELENEQSSNRQTQR